MRLDPGLTQSLARAEGELRDDIPFMPSSSATSGRLHLLDLGVPEHLLPAGRQRAIRLSGQAAIERVVGGVRLGIRIGERVDLVDRRLALSPAAQPAAV